MSIPLFDALEEINRRIKLAPHLLLYLVFDGSVISGKQEPEQPGLAPALDRALRVLAEDSSVSVVLLSGRQRADLQARVGIPGLIYCGNQGLEISGPGRLFVEPTAAKYSADLKELAAVLAQKLEPIPGAVVENKGLTISIHYQNVAEDNKEKVEHVVHDTLARKDHPFLLSLGNKTYEIQARAYWNKANAVSWIKEQLEKLDALEIYLGDDVSDEEVFAALTEGITAKVGEPSETKAKYHLAGPVEVGKFLDWLVRRSGLRS